MSHTTPDRHGLALGALLLAALPVAQAASLRTITDVWGGNGNGSLAQGCTTYAPIADLTAFFNGGGFRVLGGNVACGYAGVTADLVAATGPLLSAQTLPVVALDTLGSSFAGAASARASYGALGVSAQGQLVGTTSGTTATYATGAAWFQDTLSASSPLVAPSAPGFVRYVFSLDGSLWGAAANNGLAAVQLSLQQATGPVLGLGRLSTSGQDMPTLTAIDSDLSTWALATGALSGAGSFGSTVHVPFFGDIDLPILWGVPWDLQVGLLATTARTADANFIASAHLVEVQLFDAAHHRVTDVSLTALSGTDYLAAAVPEPAAWALLLPGLALLACKRRLSHAGRPAQAGQARAVRCVERT